MQPVIVNTTRDKIVRGARERFFVHGFRGVTMDDLARELGMSKKTLYANFASKTELVDAVIMNKFEQVDADLARVCSAPGNFESRLHDLLICVQRHLDEFRPPFIRDMRREEPDLFKRVEERRRESFQRHFGQLFGEGRKSGLIRRDLPQNLMIEVLLGAVQAIMNPQKVEELGLTPKAAFTAIITLVMEGATVKRAGGRKL
jgi:AcrR family transcriptional regulator